MKILILNWRDLKHPRAGGAEVRLHEIYKRLVKRGHQVCLLSSRDKSCLPYELVDGIEISRKGSDLTYPLHCIAKLKRAQRSAQFDIVIEDFNKLPVFSPWFYKGPLLIQMHHLWKGSIFKEASFLAATVVWLSEQSLRFVYKKQTFCVVSESTKSELLTMGPRNDSIEVIHNGTELEFYKPTSLPKERFILWLSRIQKYKGILDALVAFEQVIVKHPNLILKIAGDGPFKEDVQKFVIEKGLQNRVEFLGFIQKDLKRELLQKAICLWQTSYKEGWGLTVTEAGACGCPVIANRAPGLVDSVKEGVNGQLYNFAEPLDLAKCTNDLLNSDTLQRQYKEGGMTWSQNFTWDKAALETEELLEGKLASER